MDEEERVSVQKRLLADNSFTDLTVKIGSEVIPAHAAVVSCRCEYIIPFVQDEKSKKKKKFEVKLKDGTVKSGSIFQKILEYIYTGRLDFGKLTHEEILHVNIGARNLNLTHLVYLCEKWVIDNISMDNIFHLLKASNDLNESRMKGFCLTFALQRYTDVISNKDGIKILGIELFQEVVASFNPQAVKTLDQLPVINSTFNEDFKRLYEHMPYSDITFPLEGEQIKSHKAILNAHAETLSTLFKVENSIQYERISKQAFRSVLKFFYYSDDNIEQGIACELVPFCKKHKLNSLLKICEDKIRFDLSVDTVLDVLMIAYTSLDRPDLNEEIKAKAFPFLLDNLAKVNLQNLRVNHPMLVLDLLFKLQEASKKGTMDLPRGSSSSSLPSPHSHSPHSPSPHSHAPPVTNEPVVPQEPPPKLSQLGASGGLGNYRKNSSNNNNNNGPPPSVPSNFPPPVSNTPPVPVPSERREMPPPPMRAGRPPPPPRDKSMPGPSPPPRNASPAPRGLTVPPRKS